MMFPSPCSVRSLSRSWRLARSIVRRSPRPCEHCRQFFEREGLGQIIVGAGAHRLDRRGDRGKGRHHDDCHLRVQHLDLFQQLEAGPCRRLEIEKEDVDAVAAQQAAGGGKIFDGVWGESPAGGDFAACRSYRGVFVDDQDMQPSRTL